LSEASNYRVNVSGYSGDAGYDAFSYQDGMMFSTYDRDNDRWDGNCAAVYGGGFWQNNCCECGVNSENGYAIGNGWRNLPGGPVLQSSRMWLQCK